MKRNFRLIFVAPLLLLSFALGYRTAIKPNYINNDIQNIENLPDKKAEEKKELREFPPDFWDDHYSDELDDWNIYISKDNEIAFKYPKDMIVFQKETDGNIYLFPVERVKNNDFELGKGFALVIFKYGDYEFLIEDGAEIRGYSPYEFRFEDYFDDLSGVTFFNKTTDTYITKAETPELGYSYIYNIYKNEEEQEIGKRIIGTIVNDKRFELEKQRRFSAYNIKQYKREIGDQTKLNGLNIKLLLPTGYEFEEVLNEDNKSTRASITKGNCSLQISDNPEYVGFSTSGALCANAGINSCLYYGKYFIPEIGNSMTIVRNYWNGKTQGYRGVAYGGNSGVLSASMIATDRKCIKEMLDILYSISKP